MQKSIPITEQYTDNVDSIYPESDGEPMAENTKKFHLITTLQGGIDTMFAERDDVFCAGDLFWYPVEGKPTIRLAPDIMVVFGRPRGDRCSYMQWKEEGIAPQVVIEIISPGNDPAEMMDKLEFYDQYGVEEYYTYNPQKLKFNAWQRHNGHLQYLYKQDSWSSPRLGITFTVEHDNAEGSTYGLAITRQDGTRFERFLEVYQRLGKMQKLAEEEALRAEQEALRAEQEALRAEQEALRAEQEALRAEQEALRAEQEALRAEQEKIRADQEKERADRLLAQLLAAGIKPEED